MTTSDVPAPAGPTRRGFLGLGAALVGGSLIAACGGGSASGGSGDNTLAFWDMPWGSVDYTPVAKGLTESYRPAGGLPAATYQSIPWSNFVSTFSSAIASSTGPAVSTGGGFQAFQFADQGAIARADDVIKAFQADGTADDFLPGMLDAMKTPGGYVAIPWQADMRIWWYRKSLLDEAGVSPPTTWDELLTAGEALARNGVYGFGTGAGTTFLGSHAMTMMMINNGGGIFDPDGRVDLLTDRNIEAMTFVRELVNAKVIDPSAVSYSRDNTLNQWRNRKFAMGIDTPGLDANIGDDSGDLRVMDPISGPHGDKACLVFLNNIMMYANTPSREGSQAFLAYYVKNMKTLWQRGVVPGLPVLKSIVALPAFQRQTQNVKIINDWQPIAKTYATRSTQLSSVLAKIDGGDPLNQFTQAMLTGRTAPRAALVALQDSLAAIVK